MLELVHRFVLGILNSRFIALRFPRSLLPKISFTAENAENAEENQIENHPSPLEGEGRGEGWFFHAL